MFSTTLKLQVSSPAVKSTRDRNLAANSSSRRSLTLRLPERRLASLSLQTGDDAPPQPSLSSQQQEYTSAVGSPPSPLQWNLTQRHIVVLNVIACVTAVSATWLFCAAIPTLLAFKRAAESLEKLLDVTREELPDTMAAVRLSGMEISDLTMELSDLGQEITQGVKSSTRAVRIAEERLRRMTNMAPSVQEVPVLLKNTAEPMLAKTARGVRQTVVKGRAVFQMFFSITKFSRILLGYFASRAKP